MNATKYEFSTEDLTFDVFEKIVIVVFWMVIQIPGNVSLLGLIQFDRLGGDPLKRRIQDQLFTLGCMIALFRNLTCFNLLTISALFDICYPFFITYIYQLFRIFSIAFYILLINQTCIIRFLIEFIWKSVRSINDSFVIRCITVINTLLSFIFAAWIVWDADRMKGSWRLSHNHPLLMTVIDGEHPLRYVPYRLCFYARIIKKVKTFWPKNAPCNGERVVILLVTTRTILEHMRIITQKRIITKRA